MSNYGNRYPLKATLLAWSELNLNEIESILTVFNTKNFNEIYNFLENLFYLSQNDAKSRILIDMHYYAIKYAIDNNFSKIQMSSFLSILRALHRANQENPFENYTELITYFYELIICHSIKRPPFCLDIFDRQVAAKCTHYLLKNYLKFYKLYKYVFTPNVGLDLNVEYTNRTPTPSSISRKNSSQSNTHRSTLKNADTENTFTITQMNTTSNRNAFKNPSESSMVSSTEATKKSVISNSSSSTMADANKDASLEMKQLVRKMMLDHLQTEQVKQKLQTIYSSPSSTTITESAKITTNKKK